MTTVWEVIQNSETNTKCILLYLMILSQEAEDGILNIDVAHLCQALGLGKGQVYRAQSQLKKVGLLKITPTYSKATGNKEFDTYEFVK